MRVALGKLLAQLPASSLAPDAHSTVSAVRSSLAFDAAMGNGELLMRRSRRAALPSRRLGLNASIRWHRVEIWVGIFSSRGARAGGACNCFRDAAEDQNLGTGALDEGRTRPNEKPFIRRVISVTREGRRVRSLLRDPGKRSRGGGVLRADEETVAPELIGSSPVEKRFDRECLTMSHGKLTSRMIGGAALAAFLVAFAASSFAQDAGVSGVPNGPGSINGINGSVRDPSGIGNAGKVAPLPPPSVQPATPSAVTPMTSTRPATRLGSSRARTANLQHAGKKAQDAAVKENDRLLTHGVTSICRGC